MPGKPEAGLFEYDGLVFYFCHYLYSNLIELDMLFKMYEKEEKGVSGFFTDQELLTHYSETIFIVDKKVDDKDEMLLAQFTHAYE